MRRRRRSFGFSLLELVAVVTLLGIVTAVVMTRLSSTDRSTATGNVTSDNVRMLQTSVERYRFDNGTFPADVTTLLNGGYITKMPLSLEPGKSYQIDAGGVVEYK